MNPVIQKIRKELLNNADRKTRESGERFFKEPVKLYGIKTALVHEIAKEEYKTIKNKTKKEIFALCDELWLSGYLEEATIACDWAYALHKQYEPEDFKTLEKWVKNYVSNWAACDCLCNHSVGTLVEIYPEYLKRLKEWALSQNRWVRRASAVSLIVPARNGKFLKDIFSITDILLCDADDMVRKGYGWMLKAASEAHQTEVFSYVMKNKNNMPRTALRYAIEKMPENLKKQAMKR